MDENDSERNRQSPQRISLPRGLAAAREGSVSGAGAPRVLAVIPARGGSKGLPRKNIRTLGGRPLVAHSIEAALACPAIDRVVVSTDSEEVAEAALRHGAEVPFLRPASLSGDEALVGDAVSHARRALEAQGYRPAVLVTLYPTHPFRPPGLLDALVALNLAGHTPVVTARRVAPQPLFLPAGGPPEVPPAQLIRPYGLYEGHTLAGPLREACCHVLDDPVTLHDIDTPEDLAVAEEILRLGLFPPREGR